jgi:hypothetical protein
MGTLFSDTGSLPLHVQQPLMPIVHEVFDFLLNANWPKAFSEKKHQSWLYLCPCVSTKEQT